MSTTERTGDALWIFDGAHKHYIEVVEGCADIRVCDHRSHGVEAACMDVDDAVAMLRAMLREIAGPSIDDVREVWGVAHADMEVQAEDVFAGYTEATVCVWDGSRHRCFDATTLREALQAAYDAGVEMRGGSDPPP